MVIGGFSNKGNNLRRNFRTSGEEKEGKRTMEGKITMEKAKRVNTILSLCLMAEAKMVTFFDVLNYKGNI